jgi:hypothetical protein
MRCTEEGYLIHVNSGIEINAWNCHAASRSNETNFDVPVGRIVGMLYTRNSPLSPTACFSAKPLRGTLDACLKFDLPRHR